MNTRDAERDRWMQARGLRVLRFTGSDIWMRPDKVLADIAAVVRAVVPVRILPAPVPLNYLASNCIAALPLLLRRGRPTVPLLSLQSSTRITPSPAVLRWLETSEKIVLLSRPTQLALATTVQETEIIQKARRDPMIIRYLPPMLDANWLGYLQWRQESREQRAQSLKRIRELPVPMLPIPGEIGIVKR